MSQISLKSISGITSITTPDGVDNQLTLHNNNTSEAVKLDTAGNLHFHNHLNITGVSTASNFKTGTSNLHNTGLNVQDLDVDGHTNLDNVSIAGVTTFAGTVNYPVGAVANFFDDVNFKGPSGRDIVFDKSHAELHFSDDTTIIMGTNDDLFITHDGTNPSILTKFGTLDIKTSQVAISTNMTVGGILTATTLNVNNDLDVDGHTNLDNVSVSGASTCTGGAVFMNSISLNASTNNYLYFNDNLNFTRNGHGNEMTIDSSGRLLIGTTTEGLATYGEDLTIASSDHAGITLRTGTGHKGTVYFSDGTSGDSEYKGSIQYDHSDDSLRLAAGGSVRLRVENTGEVRMLPSTGGNTATQFSFNNTSSTPFISIKSNNVNEAAELRVEESSGGASWVFKNKNLNSLLHTHLKIDPNGAIHTAEDGNVKSHPIINGMYTQHDALEGQLNYHSLMAPDADIGGWVFLGHDYGPNPYPVRTFKIAVPESGNSAIGTRVYQVYHNGDANYDYGGLYEIRINQWANSSRFESVSIRCINGKRDDLAVVAYNNTNGIMLRPSTIWGSVWIRLAGWDENQVKRGSSYCAVQNNGALAIYNSQGTDDGTVPTSGSPFELLPYPEGTGGRDIENNNSFNG